MINVMGGGRGGRREREKERGRRRERVGGILKNRGALLLRGVRVSYQCGRRKIKRVCIMLRSKRRKFTQQGVVLALLIEH